VLQQPPRKLARRYLPGGDARGVFDDDLAYLHRNGPAELVRASRVEAVPEGKRKGEFFVDFSPIADFLHDDSKRVCLTKTFATHRAAVSSEVAWLKEQFVLAPVTPSPS